MSRGANSLSPPPPPNEALIIMSIDTYNPLMITKGKIEIMDIAH